MIYNHKSPIEIQPGKAVASLLMLQPTVLIFALLLGPITTLADSDTPNLEYRYNSAVKTLAMPFGKDSSANAYELDKSLSKQNTLIDQLKTEIKNYMGTPMYTLFKGEYEGGADKYTEGMAYKAEWDQKGVSFEIKYQF